LCQALGPGLRSAADQVGPSSIDLSANNPIPGKLKVTARLATGKHGGCTFVLDKEESRQRSVDLVIGKGAAEHPVQLYTRTTGGGGG
jgi:hypothetical protein